MRALVPAFVLIALAVPVHADHCWSEHGWTTSAPETSAAGFYVDLDWCQLDASCMWSVWVYQETNGLDGLQRQDEVVDDTCHGMIHGDTIIF